MSAPDGPPVVAVVGPTATGKTELALDLAEALGGPEAVEVVNADAMQLYRGMDIGTAKLPPAERRGIAHHQLDVLDVTEEASAAAYQRHARADVAGIAARGARAVLVGGSGLYVRAVLDDIEFPPTDPQLRARLEAEATVVGAPAMHARLARHDPQAAAAVLPGNVRRVVRALEVIELTGRPFSATLPTHRYAQPACQVAISVARDELDAAIAARAWAMLDGGLVEETRTLLAAGLAQGRTASRAVGYSQVVDLIAGRSDVATTIEAMSVATRRLARRQERWFRRDPRITWLSPGDGLAPRALAALAAAGAR